MPEVSGKKLVNLEDLKVVYDVKLDKDFNGMSSLPSDLEGTDLLPVRRPSANSGAGETYKVPMSAINPTPYVATIPVSSWSGSGNDYYISVSASNITADSILIPHYDNASAVHLRGLVWCVPAAGSFSIHTSALPNDVVSILVQFVGVLGEADYQVLADVYSKSQIDAMIYNGLDKTASGFMLDARAGKTLDDAKVNYTDVVNNLTNGETRPVSSGAVYTAVYGLITVEEYSTTLTTSKYNSFYYGNVSVDTRNIISVIVYGSASNTFASAQLLDRQQNGNIRVFGDSSGGTVYVQVVRKAT